VATNLLLQGARLLRHLPDRLLHGRRRRSAARRVAARGRPATLLFICHGNICRSPYAEASARRRLGAATRVESAGFIGPDRASPAEAVAAASEVGIDLTAHRSRVLTPEMLRAAGLVVVMDAGQRERLLLGRWALADRIVVLGDFDPEPIERRAIPDPVEKPVEAFRSCYARIERCVALLCGLWDEVAAEQTHGKSDELAEGRRTEAE
jgi:protein-tyrosine-phosphatase